MKLDNETAEKLTEALNSLSDSLDSFVSTYPSGIKLSESAQNTLNKLSDNLKNINP